MPDGVQSPHECYKVHTAVHGGFQSEVHTDMPVMLRFEKITEGGKVGDGIYPVT